MAKTVILSAARTPIGKFGGGSAGVDAETLGGVAMEAAGGGGLGCAAICSGGGQGDAILIEVNNV